MFWDKLLWTPRPTTMAPTAIAAQKLSMNISCMEAPMQSAVAVQIRTSWEKVC